MKKLIIAANCLLISLILVFGGIYMSYGLLWQKATASILFVVLGMINMFHALKQHTDARQFCIFLLFGLCFAMLGDIILNIQFICGAALFAIGHVFFFVSYSFFSKFSFKDLIYGTSIFVPSLLFIVLAPIFDFGGTLMEVVCVIYALIISFMVGKALSNVIRCRSLTSAIVLIGSVLFFISDLMLLLNVFGGLPKVVDYLCLSTYYPAEILLAISPLCCIREMSSKK